MSKWTRKRIIQAILRRESDGLPLKLGGDAGIDHALYQAGSRIFGSWPNAVIAAGIATDRVLPRTYWTPAKILCAIRAFARYKQPLTVVQLERKHGTMMGAARRTFGSWSRAVIAAGVDPARFQRVLPWSSDRIIEAILKRALKNEALGSSTTEPRSLVEAGRRTFGSWEAAKEAAGLLPRHRAVGDHRVDNSLQMPPRCSMIHSPGQRWSKEALLWSIRDRHQKQQPVSATAVQSDDKGLYQAARRQYGSWRNALFAADLAGPLGLTQSEQ